ncbi:MAG: serine hydrolase domain-containing protein [Hyphomicrobiaceae bacterium]
MPMKTAFTAFALMLLLVPRALCAAEPWPLPRAEPASLGFAPDGLRRIAETLSADIEKGQIPGAVLLIARRGKIVFAEALGFRDPETKAPMALDAIFSIASMTKPMVSVGIMMLVEEGRLALEDPVGKYLPQIADLRVAARTHADGNGAIATRPAKRQPTIEDLLRHTSGMTSGNRGKTDVHKLWPYSGARAAVRMTGDELLDRIAGLPLLHDPGAAWSYGFSTDVLGLLIEKISGQKLSTFLSERLWGPLGMKDTSFALPKDKWDRYARAFEDSPRTGKRQHVLHAEGKPLKYECGGGCAISTAGDYIRFTQMLLNGGALDGTRILKAETVANMTSNHLGADFGVDAEGTRAGFGFGLGFAVRLKPGTRAAPGSAGEYNWGGAYGTYFWNDPKQALAVVFMSQAPGPIRYHYRKLMPKLVHEALVH